LRRNIYTRILLILLSLLVLWASGCARHPEGIEIPEGDMSSWEENYDSLMFGPSVITYISNIHQAGKPSGYKKVETTEEVLRERIFSHTVTYRKWIETRADETRYNIISIYPPNFIRRVNYYIDLLTIEYDIFLAELSPDIQVNRIVTRTGPPFYITQIGLLIEIPEDVEPGNYTLTFIVEANGRYCGELPCVIHVIE
jgi:hypothetical protein